MKSKSKNIIVLFVTLLGYFCFSQNDCVDALYACGNSNYYNLGVSGPGIQEINYNNSCIGQENNSVWIKVIIQNSGTLGFTITPQNPSIIVDYDFWMYGPNTTCSNLGNSIRCSSTNPEAANASNNLTGMSYQETDTFEGPGAIGNSFISYINALENETYYLAIDRVVGDGNFSIEWTGTATFSAAPIIYNISNGQNLNIENCDSNGILDQSTPFNLEQNTSLAVGNQTNVITTYHLNENDAILGINPISNTTNFINTSNPQTLYIRLKNSQNSCFSHASFELKVIPLSTPNPQDLKSCDENNNGFAVFNLLENTQWLTNSNPNFEVTYHPNNSDATLLPNNYTNQNAFINETVWAKIKNTNSNCFIFKPFTLLLINPPTSFDSQLTQCDFELFPNGLTLFNLSEAVIALTGYDSTLNCTFFLNTIDALANTNALPINYTNISNPQTLSVRVNNSNTNCFSIAQLQLNVTVTPSQEVTLEKCDEDNFDDKITTFNLSDAGFETPNSNTSYYYTISDALLEQNQVNSNSFTTQPIYVRVENGNNCIGLHIINIKVNRLPNFNLIQSGSLCYNEVQNPLKLTAVISNPNGYSYSWLPNNETTSTITITQNGTYSVQVTNNVTGCKKIKTTTINASEIATIVSLEINDFQDNNNVTVNVTGIGNYVYSIQSSFGPYQTSNYFQNVPIGFHILYIKDLNGCGIIEQPISILGVPNYFTPNGDGINDTWNIKGCNDTFCPNATIAIFDRYGKLLTQFLPNNESWNGIYNGNQLPSDDYWYSILLQNGRNVKGHFSLKR